MRTYLGVAQGNAKSLFDRHGWLFVGLSNRLSKQTVGWSKAARLRA
jgi:hypothetical protein